MSSYYARPLNDQVRVDLFLEKCLGLQGDHLHSHQRLPISTVSKKIRDAESALVATDDEPTLTSKNNRVHGYRDDAQRKGLRQEVLKELITCDRLDDDDLIKLGSGGAKPQGIEPVAGRQAYLIIGLPASGKSSIVARTADKLGAIIIDSDFAKRKLPEYDGSAAGAKLVHEESTEIVLGGGTAPSLLGYCKTTGINVVIPKVGHDHGGIIALRDSLAEAGYQVHLTSTLLLRKESTLRAMDRFLATGRYVSLGLIFDGYANDPVMNYYRLKMEDAQQPGKWASFGAVNTSERAHAAIDYSSEENPAYLLTEDRK